LILWVYRAGEPAGAGIARSVDLAQHVEQWGYKRYWLAEHHSIPGLACSATPVLIAHVAAATLLLSTMTAEIALRVANNVELAHHSPAVDWRFPDGGSDSLAVPRQVARKTDIYREQSRHFYLVEVQRYAARRKLTRLGLPATGRSGTVYVENLAAHVICLCQIDYGIDDILYCLLFHDRLRAGVVTLLASCYFFRYCLRGAGGSSGLSEPGFEGCLAEPCGIAWNQCSRADFRSRVAGVWISDDFAGIFERGEAAPD
jgi:hypothetical protein